MLSVDIKKGVSGFKLDVCFETAGEVLGLLGASGCGKSMTLKCVAGIETPDEGRIVLNGRVLYDSDRRIDLSPQRRRVGYLFQQYALFPNMTVEQNISAGCRQSDKAAKADLVRAKISEMRLEGLEKKRPHQLSGGQQQRVALARILINEPELLLLDEPFTALDSFLKWQVELEVADTIKEFGRGAVFVSHSRDEIYRMCDSVCILHHGKSEKTRSVRGLFQAPETLPAALISGCKNFSAIAHVDREHAEALDWGVELSLPDGFPQETTHVGVRAHYVTIYKNQGRVNSFPCKVERVVDDVFSTIVMLSPGEGLMSIRAEGEKKELESICVGESVFVSLPPERLMPVRE